jgi:hypothetical protein
MRKFLFLGFVLLVSCYNKPFHQEPIDLLFRIKSTSNVDYQISEIYPNTPRSKNLKLDSVNAYYPNFDVNYDSAFYVVKNTVNRRQFYFSLKYKYKVVEDLDKADVSVRFYDFLLRNLSLDSVNLVKDELWLFCE